MSGLFTQAPLLAILAVALLIAAVVIKSYLSISLTTILLAMLLFFYRVPRDHKEELMENKIYAPCYGTIMDIIETDGTVYVTVFLSLFDVHVQYYPVSGTLVERQYDPTGQFALAYEADKSSDNEKAIHVIRTTDDKTIKVIQIAGKFVRRITYDDKQVGDKVVAGERLGMIEFGSRVDIEFPNSYKLLVSKGDRVKGPNSVIAEL